MNKVKIFSFLLLACSFISKAQDIDQAKKAIDAEQFDAAKKILKSALQLKPGNGKAMFLLGNVYIKQNQEDSAKVIFSKGLLAPEMARFNYIGLGQLDLNNNNLTAAQANFVLATKDLKKKDIEEWVYVAKAYLNADKPDYNAALTALAKASAVNNMDPATLLTMGDAYYGLKNQNDAFKSYRDAFNIDGSLIRAKVQMGVLLKGAKAYTDAILAFNEVTTSNPTYGPVYRELAETYYYWAKNEPKNYNNYIPKALEYYEKYMTLTDYSLASRMRHADFLILAKDYKSLELEANAMKDMDKVNPRILRYLGYSAYENGNVDVAIKSLEDFIGNPSNKIISRDYLYLGQANLKKAYNLETKVTDQLLFDKGITFIAKAVELDSNIISELSDVGATYYRQKMFNYAIAILNITTSNANNKNMVNDNYFLGYALYFDNKDKSILDKIALQKADTAFAKVIEASPTTQDAFIFRARINQLLQSFDLSVKFYEDYVRLVEEKGADEITKYKVKMIESYSNIALFYKATDKLKAKDYFKKIIALDPTNELAIESLK
jgi:predicted Zn-dependent protease